MMRPFIFIALMLLATPALALEPCGKMAVQEFKKLDTNDDQALTPDEYMVELKNAAVAKVAMEDQRNMMSPAQAEKATPGELRAKAQEVYIAAFKQQDADHDGKVTPGEWTKAYIPPPPGCSK
jgi:hypothetical protein